MGEEDNLRWPIVFLFFFSSKIVSVLFEGYKHILGNMVPETKNAKLTAHSFQISCNISVILFISEVTVLELQWQCSFSNTGTECVLLSEI